MENGDYDYPTRSYTVIDAVWESGKRRFPYDADSQRITVRLPQDRIERGLDFQFELRSEAGALAFVPDSGVIVFLLCGTSKCQ
jgi:hypothetical protein